MVMKQERENFSLPDSLAFELLVDALPGEEMGPCAVGGLDGFLEALNGQLVHSILFYAIRKLDAWVSLAR